MPVISFDEYTPIPRFDGVPWSTARIEESSSKDGPWTEIETKSISPVDADPASPAPRSFTTDNAVLESGWYRIVFLDALGKAESPTSPVHNAPAGGYGYTPTVSELGAILRARTKDRDGNELGTFTAATRPTFAEVQSIIDDATDDVVAEIDTDLPEESWGSVRKLIALRAAMTIELSYWPEQVATERSPYAQYKDLFTEGLTRVKSSIQRETIEEAEGELTSRDVYWSFPSRTDWDRITW